MMKRASEDIDRKIKDLFKGLHHFGFYVNNIDEIIRLYCDTLGMELERDTGFDGLDKDYIDFINTITGIRCSNARIVYLKSFDTRIELVQFVENENGNLQGETPINTNSFHIGYVVKGIEDIYDYFISKGHLPISKIESIPAGVNKGVKVVYFISNKDQKFELMQFND